MKLFTISLMNDWLKVSVFYLQYQAVTPHTFIETTRV